MGALDLVRLLVGVAVLAFASWTDWKWRRAPPILWHVVTGVGLALLAFEAWLDPAPASAKWPYLILLAVPAVLVSRSTLGDVAALGALVAGALVVGLVASRAPDAVTSAWLLLVVSAGLVVFLYVAHYFGLIAGGADASALIALCVLMPFPIALADGAPLWASPLPGALVAFGNSLVAFLAVPLALALWNLAHGDIRVPHLFLATPRPANALRRGYAWPMETIDETGRRRTRYFASRAAPGDIEEQLQRFEALGSEKVWMTPKIPYMIPLLVGFVLAFFLGDVMTTAIRAFSPVS